MKALLYSLAHRFPEAWNIVPTIAKHEPWAISPKAIDATTFGKHGHLVEADGTIRSEPCGGQPGDNLLSWTFPSFKSNIIINTPAFFAGGWCSLNHAHLILDIIPLIHLHGQGKMIVVHPGFTERHYQLFAFFGIPGYRVYRPPSFTPTRFTNITVAHALGLKMSDRMNVLRKLYSPFDPNLTGPVYISRHLATRRHIHNEPELLDMFHRNGVRVVDLEKWPIKDQIDLLRSSQMVIMPHGAAGANLAWKDSGRVIEIMPVFGWGTTAIELALHNRFQYTCIGSYNWGTGMKVNVDHLKLVCGLK